jgi:hypothetical protein
LNAFASRIERNAIHFGDRVDKSPMRANVTVFKRDMVRSRFLPPIFTAAALVKISSLHHELRQPRDAVRDTSGFI